jgi:hypothetical protein
MPSIGAKAGPKFPSVRKPSFPPESGDTRIPVQCSSIILPRDKIRMQLARAKRRRAIAGSNRETRERLLGGREYGRHSVARLNCPFGFPPRRLRFPSKVRDAAA